MHVEWSVNAYASIEVPETFTMKSYEGFVKDSSKWVIFPRHSYTYHGHIEERNLKIGEDFSTYKFNTIEGAEKQVSTKMVFASGISYAYAKEYLKNHSEVALVKLAGKEKLDVNVSGKLDGKVPHNGENSANQVARILSEFLGIQEENEMLDLSDAPQLLAYLDKKCSYVMVNGDELCDKQSGMHYWDDYIYIEIIDPKTGIPVEDGQEGEIVITTLVKEGAPLLRFRTHDISRIIPGECPCGRKHPRLDIIQGRSDDMFKVHGVNMFPSQVEEILGMVDGVSSEYNINIAHDDSVNRDVILLTVEAEGRVDFEATGKKIKELYKSKMSVTPKVTVVPVGTLPRTEKKAKRIIDHRDNA